MAYLKRYWRIILIVLLPFAIYSHWSGSEYNLDDELVVDNKYIGSGPQVIPEIFSDSYFNDGKVSFGYRPVVILSYFLESYFFGINPAVSHLINVILYSILCLILYHYLRLLLPNAQLAVITGAILIFVVHPLHVEVVASAKNREEMLAFVFLGLTAIGSLKYVEKRNYLWIVAIILMSVLAVFSKKSALPGLLVLPAAIIMFRPYRVQELGTLIAVFFLVVGLTSPFSPDAFFAIITCTLSLYYLLNGLKKEEPLLYFKVHLLGFPGLLFLHLLAIVAAFYLPLWGLVIPFLPAAAYFLASKYKVSASTFLVLVLAAIALEIESKHLLLLCLLILGQTVISKQGTKVEILYSFIALIISTACMMYLHIKDFRYDYLILIGYVGVSLYLFQSQLRKGVTLLLYGVFSVALVGYLMLNSTSYILVLVIIAAFSSTLLSKKSRQFNFFLASVFVITVFFSYPEAMQSQIFENAPAGVVSSSMPQGSIIRDIGRELHPTESVFVNNIDSETRWSTSIFILGEYLRLHVWPHPLRFFYGYAFITEKSFGEVTIWIYLLLYAALGITALWFVKSRPAYSFGILFYMVCLLPFSNLWIPVAGMMGERLTFTASLGFCIALSSVLSSEHRSPYKWASVAIISIVCLTYGTLSYNRAALWKDKLTLYLHDIEYTQQSAKMNQLVGSLFYDMSRISNDETHFEKAIYYLDRAKKIFPDYEVYWTISAMAYQKFGYFQEAIADFRRTIEIDPTYSDAYFNIAASAEQIGDIQTAVEYYQRYIELEPSNTNVYANLGFLYFRIGAAEKAIEVIQKAINRFPNDPDHLVNLGKIYTTLGDNQNAIYYFQLAADMDFTDPQLYFALASLLEERGSLDEAAFYREIGNSKR